MKRPTRPSLAPALALPALAVLVACAPPPPPPPPVQAVAIPAEVIAVVDRAAIENMLVDYYAQLGSGRHDFGAYYIAAGRIDVDGQVAQGQEAIEKLYGRLATDSPPEPGTFRMLLSNVQINVNGDKATAAVLWTGLLSASLTELPRVVEQGRENDELVKVDGKWKFSNRIITSDGGLNKKLLKDYVKR